MRVFAFFRDQNRSIYLHAAALILSFLFVPSFVYGVASLWALLFLFVFVHLGRSLCQSSLKHYQARLSHTNEGPKIKSMIIALCAYLSLPFLAYVFIVGDLNSDVASGLDRALILSLPLEAIQLPIEGHPSVFQMLLVQQVFVSCLGFGIGMLFARKEILAMSLPDMPENIRIREDMSHEERNQQSDLWITYEIFGGVVFVPALLTLPFTLAFFKRFWPDDYIHALEYIFVIPSIFLLPFVIFLYFFAFAIMKITLVRR